MALAEYFLLPINLTAKGNDHHFHRRWHIPYYLRLAGYYCTNKAKEDYNLQKKGKVWDDSSNKAHWKNRKNG